MHSNTHHNPVAAAARLRWPFASLKISSVHAGQRSLAAAATGSWCGIEVHVEELMAALRSSAARAALPGQRPVLHLFRASFVWGITWFAFVFRAWALPRPPDYYHPHNSVSPTFK
ncbi:hypothetical protein [Pseudomonas sp. TE3610]